MEKAEIMAYVKKLDSGKPLSQEDKYNVGDMLIELIALRLEKKKIEEKLALRDSYIAKIRSSI